MPEQKQELSTIAYCCTTTDHLTVDTLTEAVALLGRDPLAEWMKSQGFDPSQGGRLLWPANEPADWGIMGPPSYVSVTDLIPIPMLIDNDVLCKPNMTWEHPRGPFPRRFSRG